MNLEEFKSQLNQLSDSDWQALYQGKSLEMLDDQAFNVTNKKPHYLIVNGSDNTAGSPIELKQEIIKSAEEIFKKYYQIHPLTKAYFNRQLKSLAEQLGTNSFIANMGNRPAYTFFVDNGEVLAVPQTSPKFPYGVYLELDKMMDSKESDDLFNKWVESGKAYESYRSMNVCRYNC